MHLINKIYIRYIKKEEIDEVLRVEKESWPEGIRASKEQFLKRFETFPEGFFGAYLKDFLVGSATSQIIKYEKSIQKKSWDSITDRGFIENTHDPNGDCLYLVSSCVIPKARNLGIWKSLALKRIRLAESLNLKYVSGHARAPGFKKYRKNTSLTIENYIKDVKSKKIFDPVLSRYLNMGFEIKSIVKEGMSGDFESENFSISILKKLFNETIHVT